MPRLQLFIRIAAWLLILLVPAGGALPVAFTPTAPFDCSCPSQSEEHPGENGREAECEVGKKAVRRRSLHLETHVAVAREWLLWTRSEATTAPAPIPAWDDTPLPLLEFLTASLGLRAPPASS